MLPKEPVILLSYVNTQLRDYYASLDEMCHSFCVEPETVKCRLKSIDYEYDSKRNQFV